VIQRVVDATTFQTTDFGLVWTEADLSQLGPVLIWHG
jgi:hypothetical protein